MRKYIWAAIIFAFSSVPAHAEPITALIVGIGNLVSAFAASITASGLISFSGLSAFLASPIGSLIVGIGLQLISSLFVRRPQVPSIEAGKVNVRISEPERWINAGGGRQGGGVLFAEYDAEGNLWYLVAHSDSYHTGVTKRFFDDIEIETDVDNWVTTNAFCLDNDNNTIDDTYVGTKKTFFQIYTTTHTRLNPTPPQIAAFQAAFPGAGGWTNDHKLVGTTYSVVKCKSVKVENSYKVYRWRGPIGLGEPSVSIVANWSEPYDPRTETYAHTFNAALIWAWFRTHPYGRNKSVDSINWEKLAEQADICDIEIVGIQSTQPQWEASVNIPESKDRASAEMEILLACDGQLVFDDDGRCWPRVGYYYEPTLTLSRNRDIMAMESAEAQNGESETQGVIVRYIDEEANYTTQPSAAWKNPIYYDPLTTPKYLSIDALSIRNHNQAMRLAKAIGMRSQSTYKLLPTTGLRGLKARQERIVDLLYDNVFSGDHEIVTPVEVDENGIFCGMGLVPVDQYRWTLLPGEEQPKPVIAASVDGSLPTLPTGVVVAYDGAKIIYTFDAPIREDFRYEFEGRKQGDTKWLKFSVNMDDLIAYLGGPIPLKYYELRYRTVTTGGKATGYFSPPNIFTSLLTITGTPVTSGKVGVAYAGFTVGVTGGTSPYFFVDVYGRLPPGITINSSTGAVSGTPTLAGTYPDIRLRISDVDGAFNYVPAFSIVVIP